MNLGLCGRCRRVLARAAMQHGDRCHPLRGNGKRHKPDQHSPEQLPHGRTLQELPRLGRRSPERRAGVGRILGFNPVLNQPGCSRVT